jgi:acyl transferase domain-containing protein
VIAGPAGAIDIVRRVADALGVRTVPLPAPYAFHSQGMALAAHEFADAVAAAGISGRPLRLPVYSPLLGDYVPETEDLLALMVRHLTTRVDFLSAIRTLHADGVRAFVECGRSGLTRLVRATVPDLTEPAVESGHAEKSVHGTQPASPSQPAQPSTVDADAVLVRLRELYATTLGYPVEAVEGDADLEADLGVDSLKRAEMLGKVAAHFGLPESANDGRFLVHATLAELADMITATLADSGVSR